MKLSIQNFSIKFISLLLIVSFSSCEKKAMDDEQSVTKSLLTGTWNIDRVESDTDVFNNTGDVITIDIWDETKNGDNGTISLKLKDGSSHSINIGGIMVGKNDQIFGSSLTVIGISMNSDWTSSLLKNQKYSSFNSILDIESTAAKLTFSKNIKFEDGTESFLKIYTTKINR